MTVGDFVTADEPQKTVLESLQELKADFDAAAEKAEKNLARLPFHAFIKKGVQKSTAESMKAFSRRVVLCMDTMEQLAQSKDKIAKITMAHDVKTEMIAIVSGIDLFAGRDNAAEYQAYARKANRIKNVL